MGTKITADEISTIIKERIDNFELNPDLSMTKESDDNLRNLFPDIDLSIGLLSSSISKSKFMDRPPGGNMCFNPLTGGVDISISAMEFNFIDIDYFNPANKISEARKLDFDKLQNEIRKTFKELQL